MCPDTRPPIRVQRGFALASAIFLLVVLAALGAAMLTFSSTQHAGAAMDVQSARAYQAARAGIEWGAYRVLRNNNCAASTTVALESDLAGFNLVVECAATTHGTLTAYQITSTGSIGSTGEISRAERQLQARIVK